MERVGGDVEFGHVMVLSWRGSVGYRQFLVGLFNWNIHILVRRIFYRGRVGLGLSRLWLGVSLVHRSSWIYDTREREFFFVFLFFCLEHNFFYTRGISSINVTFSINNIFFL